MNRTTLVFASILALISSSNAVDLTGTITGAPGSPGTNISSVTTLNISSATITGGAAVEETFDYDGEDGIQIMDADLISIVSSSFQGSDAGDLVSLISSPANAIGGRGVDLRGTFVMNELGNGVVAQGGDGGNIDNFDGATRAYGGHGMQIATLSAYDLTISGGSYSGGSGGQATFSSAENINPFAENNYFGEFAGSVGGPSGASGGHGLRVFNDDYLQYGTTLTIDGGVFSGGDGGISQNNGTGDSVAAGGHGIFADFVDLTINGGDFSGGAAGVQNGATGEAGYGVLLRDGNLTITDGNFSGNGLWFESHYYDSAAAVSGGTFGDAVFAARYDEFFGSIITTSTDISGGTFDSVTFAGVGTNAAFNTATITGGTIGDLYFSGSVADSATTISLGPAVTVSGGVQQDGGIVNVEQWSDAHFANTTILDGTMNFNNQLFNLGGIFELQSTNAAANFNNGLTVQDGGILNLGLGAVTASSVLAEDGSRINTIFNGTTLGQITSTGALTVDSGTQWMIDAGTNAVALDDTFDLATAAGAITNNITESDVMFNGSGGEAGWLGGISELQVVGTALRATYGESDIDVALGVAGNTSTEFGKAMADFAELVSDEGSAQIKTLASSQQEGALLMSNSYVRTVEMASTLVGLQSVFSDQIKDRTRSHLRQQEVGYPSASTPAGSAGWEPLRLFSDRVENAFGYDEVESAVAAVVPDFQVDVMDSINAAVPVVKVDDISLPVTYQTWGRGYGSFIEQDTSDGFAGYDATIGGGILGLDKQINNVLLGLAGGYARTVVDGDTGKDGTSDTGHAAVYFSAHGDHLFLDANASYAYNDVETEYDTLGYKGDYAAHTVGLYLGGGFGIPIANRFLLTPEASILSAFYKRDAYTEKSALYPDMEWDSYDQWSHLGTVGATLSMIHKIDLRDAEMAVQPELRAHLLHEFNDEFDDETYMMVDGASTGSHTVGASLKAREEDLVKVGAGVRLSKWASDTTEIGFDVDGTFGDDYTAYIISGKIVHRF